MSSSSSTTRNFSSRTGFSAVEVQDFLSKGNTSASNLNANLSKPKILKRERRQIFSTSKSFFGSEKKVVGPVEFSGFLGKFSNKSDEELRKLVDIFKKRRTLIKNKQRSPGASQTRLLG